MLIEAGEITEWPIDEMIVLASLYVDSLDGEAAARSLQDVLAYDPPNLRARQMLHELSGYEVIDEPDRRRDPAGHATRRARSGIRDAAARPNAPRYDGHDGYDPSAPLPSYDL